MNNKPVFPCEQEDADPVYPCRECTVMLVQHKCPLEASK